MKIDQQDLQASLDEYRAQYGVAGASAAILHKGQVIAAATGTANMAAGIELTPQTVMHIGSITKVLGSTLVMQLVDEGKVDLGAPVVRYLPDLKLKDPGALPQITVRMLLNHTSGIDGEGLPDCGHDEETIEKGVVRLAQLGQLFQPGTEFSYCNAGTVVAGYLAQRVTGKSWYRLIRERIFEPLQLQHAVTLPEEALLHRASVGHYFNPDSKRLARTSFAFLPMGFSPAGVALMMSASDLIEFARAHLAHGVGSNGVRILSAQSAKAMQTMSVDNRGKGYAFTDGIGLGWMVDENGLLQHSGGAPGVVSMLYAHPEREWAAAVLTNSDNGLDLINRIMAPWLEEIVGAKPLGMGDIRIPAVSQEMNPDRYVGVYEDVANRFRVTRTSDGLALSQQAKFAPYETISTEEKPAGRLTPLGHDQFLLDSLGEGVLPAEFRSFVFRNPDSAGRMRHLGYGMRLRPRVQ